MKKINVAELLKDCPKGMELDCMMYDNVTFDCVLDGSCYPIQIQTPEGNMRLNQHGCMSLSRHTKCIIFPKGKTTWEGFVPPYKFKDGDVVVNASNKDSNAFIYAGENDNYYESYVGLSTGTHPELSINKSVAWVSKKSGIRLATEEEKQELFDAIKANGYKWNAETKTLEELPKFKVGDRIKHIVGREEVAIVVGIEELHYNLSSQVGTSSFSIPISMQHEWELVPNKFDITTLKPFDKVLVRDKTVDKWRIELFSHTQGDEYMFIGLNYTWAQCIPYEGNEHLLNTTQDCEDFYITWNN